MEHMNFRGVVDGTEVLATESVINTILVKLDE